MSPLNNLSDEFKGGLLPNLTKPPAQKTVKQLDSIPATTRKKVTLYLDDNDLVDDLLTALRKSGLPRDNSMLVRALLHEAATALSDPARLAALAEACSRTLPVKQQGVKKA